MSNVERSMVPEDVRSELDVEQRRSQAKPSFKAPAEIPEEVLGEYDREARLASEEARMGLGDGPTSVESQAS